VPRAERIARSLGLPYGRGIKSAGYVPPTIASCIGSTEKTFFDNAPGMM
jgi:hypothetical protein